MYPSSPGAVPSRPLSRGGAGEGLARGPSRAPTAVTGVGGPGGRLERRWTTNPADQTPPAHHRLTVRRPPSLEVAFDVAGAGERLALAAAGWPVAWTSETWPTIVRPDTEVGRQLGVIAISPGLKLIECGRDANGLTAVEHEATTLTERTLRPGALQRLSLLTIGPPTPGPTVDLIRSAAAPRSPVEPLAEQVRQRVVRRLEGVH